MLKRKPAAFALGATQITALMLEKKQADRLKDNRPLLYAFHIPISTKIRLMKALVWPVATYGCESWTLRKNEETRLDAFEMKGLRRMLRVSRTAKKTNDGFLTKLE